MGAQIANEVQFFLLFDFEPKIGIQFWNGQTKAPIDFEISSFFMQSFLNMRLSLYFTLLILINYLWHILI